MLASGGSVLCAQRDLRDDFVDGADGGAQRDLLELADSIRRGPRMRVGGRGCTC